MSRQKSCGKSSESFPTKVIALTGDLTFSTVLHWRQRFIESLDKNVCSIEVDLSLVKHCDSSAVSLLLEFIRLVKVAKKSVVIINFPAQLRELIAATETTRIFKHYEYN